MSAQEGRLVWERDGMHWPHRDASRFVLIDGLRWHLQEFGLPAAGKPWVLLLHGTGASTHSWRGLAPLLVPHFAVLAMDLPGHGFTGMPEGGPLSPQLSLLGMARALGALLQQLDVSPSLVIGHSAGAAIAVRMCLDELIRPKRVLSLNGALLPLGGLAGQVFSPVARLMAAAPFVPRLFSWRVGKPAVLQALLNATGSRLDAEGINLYGQLVRNPGHAAGALGMMANWDLPQLAQDLPLLKTPMTLIVGSNDRTVSPREAGRLIAQWPASCSATRPQLVTLQGLGHLAHEERPDWVAKVVEEQFLPVNNLC